MALKVITKENEMVKINVERTLPVTPSIRLDDAIIIQFPKNEGKLRIAPIDYKGIVYISWYNVDDTIKESYFQDLHEFLDVASASFKYWSSSLAEEVIKHISENRMEVNRG